MDKAGIELEVKLAVEAISKVADVATIGNKTFKSWERYASPELTKEENALICYARAHNFAEFFPNSEGGIQALATLEGAAKFMYNKRNIVCTPAAVTELERIKPDNRPKVKPKKHVDKEVEATDQADSNDLPFQGDTTAVPAPEAPARVPETYTAADIAAVLAMLRG